MKKVIMGIGIPGSGKTTFLKSFAEKNNYTYISPDDIRMELTGNSADQSKNREVWQETYTRTAAALTEGKTVVCDATFVNSSDRKRFIEFTRQSGAEKIQGVYADVPFDIALERNHKRERVVPEYAMKRMQGVLEQDPPILEDGFDSIFTIDELQHLMDTEMKYGEETINKEFTPKFQ